MLSLIHTHYLYVPASSVCFIYFVSSMVVTIMFQMIMFLCLVSCFAFEVFLRNRYGSNDKNTSLQFFSLQSYPFSYNIPSHPDPFGIMVKNKDSLVMDSSSNALSNSQGSALAACESRQAQRFRRMLGKKREQEGAARQEAAGSICHLQKLPVEMIMMTMYHMDEVSFKSFIQTNRSGYAIWKANRPAILLGMQETQFPELSSVFGDPRGRSVEQSEAMEDIISLSTWYEELLLRASNNPSYEEAWWNHLAFLRISKENLDLEMQSLLCLSKGDIFDTALSRKAILLIRRIAVAVRAEDATQALEKPVRIFLDQPAEVQNRVLNILEFLGHCLNSQVGLTINAGTWASEEGHVKPRGSDAELFLKGALSQRIIAATFKVVLDYGVGGCSMLLTDPAEWATEGLEDIRLDFLEALDKEEATGARAWFEPALDVSREIGLELGMVAGIMASLDDWIGYAQAI